MSGRSCLAPAALALALLWAPAGHASENYPPEVERFWQLKRAPDCTLCHLTDKGGAGTTKTPFGLHIKGFGAKGTQDLPSLDRALLKSDQQTTDSDGDGVGDHEELFFGFDPNSSKDQHKPAPAAAPDGGDEPPDQTGGGGAAGAAGASSSEGGADVGPIADPASGWKPPPPPPVSSLPQFGHGCTTTAGDARHAAGLFTLGVAYLAMRLRRRRAR